MSKDNKECLNETYLDWMDHVSDVFYYHGDKITSESNEPKVIFWGYSIDLNKDSLIKCMDLMINKFINVVSEEEFKELAFNIKNNLHHTFKNPDLVGLDSIDIDIYTIPKEDYNSFHNKKQLFIYNK